MAKTNAERQRAWRTRQRETQGTAEQLAADFAAFKAKARAFAEAQLAEIERLSAALAESEAGRGVPPCTACGGQLACPSCSRGDCSFPAEDCAACPGFPSVPFRV